MSHRPCSIDGCDRPSSARGWCRRHYLQWRRSGAPEVPLRAPPQERFWRKVNKTDACWVWTAAQAGAGYGWFWDGRRPVYAHRFAYELLVGSIPEGLTLDHLCRNRLCVNPAHLEAVSLGENLRRGEPISTINARKTQCPRGHPYDLVRRDGSRWCRACTREAARQRRRRTRGS